MESFQQELTAKNPLTIVAKFTIFDVCWGPGNASVYRMFALAMQNF